MTDCDDKTDWNIHNSADPLTDPSLTVLHDDYFQLAGKCDAAADEYVYYTYDFAGNFSSDIYPKFFIRYKTSHSANGLGAKAVLNFTVGSQTIFGSTPQFSTAWKTFSGDITPGKFIDSVEFWADDYPDSVDSGTYYVYYDFMLIHKGIFTWPFVSGGREFQPPNRYPKLTSPTRIGDISQYLGAESASVRIWGDIDTQAEWKRSGDTIGGEVFYDVAHNAHSEPWQWLDLGDKKFKVTLEDPTISQIGDSKVQYSYDLLFREYRLSDASNESYKERFGI